MIRQKWSAEAVKAQIHALMGQDKDKRIVRSSVNALDDLAKRPSITDVDRISIHSGMLASVRIIEMTPPEVVDEAAWLYAQHSAEWKGTP